MSESTELAITEKNLINVLLHTDKTPLEIFPDDIDTEKLLLYSEITSLHLKHATDAVQKIRPFMGRVLLIYKKRPEMFRAMGYKTWDEWMTKGAHLKYNISRPDAYALVASAETFPNMPASEMAEIGINALKKITQIVQKQTRGVTTIEMKEKLRDKWVALAKDSEVTVNDLVRLAEEENIVEKGELNPLVPVILHVSPDVKSQFDEFKTDEEIKAYVTEHVGAFGDGPLLRALIEEASTWKAEIADANRGLVNAE